MTTKQWERENQDTLMEYFIDGDPSVRRIQCEYCRKVIYTQTRNRKYCSFQTCGHRMLNLRKSLKKRVERAPTPAAISSRYRTIRPIMPAETNVHSISRSVNGFIKPTSYPTQ